MYCQKFEEGNMDSQEEEDHDRFNTFGVYKMFDDIHNEEYTSPLNILRKIKQKSQKTRSMEMTSVLWWIGASICGLFSIVYMIALYFTYWDNDKEFERTFSNK